MEGEPFGSYLKRNVIGRGGFAEVWRAWDTKLSRWVALKLPLLAQPEDRRRFLREAQLAAGLTHPNIAAIYEVGEVDGRPFLAMQLIEGETLDSAARTPRRDLIRILHDAALAVGHAHEKGIVHRDLKPGNIMVDHEGRVFVMDFGLAKRIDVRSSLSMSGTIAGTPAYMSPEIVGGGEVDGRADVYSLGATLYALLAERTVFPGDNAMSVLDRVLREEPVPLRKLRPKIAPDLETIVLKCLEKDPSRRYGTAIELAEDLRRCRDGEAISARRPTMTYRARKAFAKRKALLLGVGGAAILVAILATGIVTQVAKAREFQNSRDRARAAFAEEDWARARMEAERALGYRHDEGLARIVSESRARMEAAAAEQRKVDTYRRLQERMWPVAGRIRETRPFFYVGTEDIFAKLDEVRATLRELEELARKPEHEGFAELWSLLGAGWYFVGHLERAEEVLLRAESLAPDDGAVHGYLGAIYLERSLLERLPGAQHESAEEKAERARKWSEKANGHLTRSTATGELERHVLGAYQALAEQRIEEVQKLCREGLDRFQGRMGSEEYWCLLGMVLPAEQGIEAFTKAIEQRPHYAWAQMRRGLRRAARKEFEAAYRDLDDAVRLRPGDATAYGTRGFVRLFEGRHEAALADFDQSLRLRPEDSLTLHHRGLTREVRKDFDGAIQDYTEALRVHPRAVYVYLYRARVYREQKSFSSAIADYTEALRIEPELAQAFASRGATREAAGDLPGALSDFDELVRLRPQDAESFNLRAGIKKGMRDFAGAFEDYGKALDLYPNYPEVYYNRGLTHLDRGDFRAAVQDFGAALRIAPNEWAHRAKVRQVMDETVRRLEAK